MVYSASLRKIIMLAFMVTAGALLIVRVVQRYGSGKEQFISLGHEEADITSHVLLQKPLLQNSFSEVELEEGTDSFGYDFAAMINLIDLSRFVKNEITGSFGFAARKRKIDQVEIKTLLEELLRERAKLRNYVLDLKGCSKVNIPPRRHRALTYYLEVIDGLASEMRELIIK